MSLEKCFLLILEYQDHWFLAQARIFLKWSRTDIKFRLIDLTSGSGDKGTPIILIQGYFDNYAK